ncbi:hypothetical protein LE181_22265 [Streptomyces sp. SCA3-4]|uniref:hypothetical protein n=1 Tax=Streptomyces sichuanensis TaxID=2871810 RepID=UPI001CE2F7EF|nr:hypothetical protein [Streptomyces sichuanensis]MCA6094883.1 hypothetical protein [Streptomyces sichuanensis]
MSEQNHRNPYEPPYDRPYEPHRPYEPYAPYEPRTAPQDGPDQQAYAYPYDQQAPAPHSAQQHQQHQQHQQPQAPAAWPQHDYPAQDEPVTQTWQTQSWDARSWQQQPAPAPAAEPAYDPPWQDEGDAGGWQQHRAPHGAAAPAAAVPVAQVSFADDRLPDARPEAGVPAAVPAEAGRPMTAAEKAKAEGRPQIVSPGMLPALITAGLALLLAGAAPLARPALAVPVVLLQAVTAAGWFRLNGMWPARQGIALAFLGGVVADVALLVAGADKAPTVMLGTLGVWILLVVVLQLRSHASPDERLYGLTAATASAALAVMAGGHLAADPDAVVVGALGVAAAVLARALPLPSVAAPVVAVLAAAGAGVAGGQLTGMGGAAALLGLAAGVCALVGLRVASYDYPSRFVHMTAGVALPLALAAPAVYVLGRALG